MTSEPHPDFDNSAAALFEPWTSARYFAGPAFAGPLALRELGWEVGRAAWLAELCRWVYLRHPERELGILGVDAHPPEARGRWLEAAGLRERRFIATELGRVSLVEGAGARVLIFRGTDRPTDWLSNIDARFTRWSGGGLVHAGFLRAWESLAAELRGADAPWEDASAPLIVTGHSLGGALAVLAAAELEASLCLTFGAPRVGNSGFAEALEGRPMIRVVNGRDLVTSLPLPLEGVGFEHAGELRYLTQDGRLQDAVSPWEVIGDRWRWELSNLARGQPRRGLFDLPKVLTDHAIINYVAHLSRLAHP